MATVSFKCPHCGGGLEFDPDRQSFRCEFCSSEFSQEELEASAVSDSAVLYTCPSCGAQVVTDETTAATFCYYCHNPVVLSGRLEGSYLPDYVLPFAIDREKALELFEGWIKKKKFVPKAFYSKEQVDKMTGVYFPYWLYSCRVQGRMEAEAYRIRVWTAGSYRYTETKKYEVVRSGAMEVKNVVRNALKKTDKQLSEGVLPFPVDEMKPFSMGYLSGFLAEKRDMGQEDFQAEVEAEVREFAAASIRGSAKGYDRLDVRKMEESIDDPKWRYALMPVWALTYKDQTRNKLYYFALNGHTGKICGILPTDLGRLFLLFLEVFLPILAVFLFLAYLI